MERVRIWPCDYFLTYAVQVALNMFRRKDSTIFSTVNLTMLFTILAMTIPFYAHPQMNLVFNSTGLQPLSCSSSFTLAISFITTGFRDKPWLLVLGSLFCRWKRVLWLALGFAVFRYIKFFIQRLNNGFRLFHENKIFWNPSLRLQPPAVVCCLQVLVRLFLFLL